MEGQVIWITGLSGAGKTTVSTALNQRLSTYGLTPILLDGDDLRKIFSCESGVIGSYSRDERIKLSKKYSLLCRNLSLQGYTIIIATISMYYEIYNWNRINLPNYFEIYLDVPWDELFKRDPKNIYKEYHAGRISNVSGMDLNVDQPTTPDLKISYKEGLTTDQIIDIIIEKLEMK